MPFVIAIFIAHQGCPHRCVFCNQWSITGAAGSLLDGGQVAAEIERQLAWPRKDDQAEVQVAFYGGSFTGLPLARQEELLVAVAPFIEQGRVRTIRLSTRPDYVDEATGPFLKHHGVGIVELGVQSLNPAVLAACERGHTVQDVEEAVHLLKAAGLTVGAQLMIGLPGETGRSTLQGARRLLGLAPDLVRIYPALVLTGSALADWWAAGTFRPLSLNKAVALAARLAELFESAGIRVVRIGLQPSPALEQDVLAGPYHPAFGELVRARLLFRKVRAALAVGRRGPDNGTLPHLRLSIARQDQSIFRGQKNASFHRLAELGLLDRVAITFATHQERGTVLVTPEDYSLQPS